MRKWQKQKLINILDTLVEAQTQFSVMDREATFELLCLCQESAIAIGNTIEKNGMYDIPAIKYLEAYCELLFQFSEEDNWESVWDKSILEMNELLFDIRESIHVNIPEESIDILFLPYNASMWDTMESVYQEAVKCEGCNVKVMPIPYYNLSKDGGPIEKYEGDKFPGHIEITDYRQYDIKQKKPEIIIIHNPYDQFNHVTRISEDYYSRELIKYTEHLVYIPYYVSDNLTDEQICIMPGVKNAWRVFVQSENVRQQYIKWNSPNKIVAVGSPKIDAVINMKITKQDIPLNWKEALQGRKVFLYNSHLSNITNISKDYDFIKKLQRIFACFEGRKDIAILWRPHPLSIETIKAMHPQILEDYLSVIGDFKRMDNSVYDDTSDNQRAIVLSDAYLGDRSSMLTLYKATGKPIYLLKDNKDDITLKYITCLDANIDESNLWIFTKEFNAFFKMNRTTGIIDYVDSIQGELKLGKALYKEMIPYNNKMFLIPSAADKIVAYDIISKSQKFYSDCRRKNLNGIKNSNVIVENDEIYLYPKFYGDDIVVFHMDTCEVEIIVVDYKLLDGIIEDQSMTVWGSAVKIGDTHWCPMTQSKHIVSIHDNETLIHDVYCNNDGFICAAYDGNHIWLAPIGGRDIVKWDPESKLSICYRNLPKDCVIRDTVPFDKILYLNQTIWLIPSNASMIIKLDINTGEMSGKDIGAERYLSYKTYNDDIYLFPYAASRHIIKLNTNTEMLEYIDLEYPRKYLGEDFPEYFAHKVPDLYKENHMFTSDFCLIDQFINSVIKGNDMYSNDIIKNLSEFIDNLDGTCGKKIWQYIMDHL